ncbi:MAG: MFS transporter [Planctomycetales bacterium]|nr:MFS transporter [Planctomycetales bacterium]MBN8624497.1 MFS transporter [Planctomycetota bacterium]
MDRAEPINDKARLRTALRRSYLAAVLWAAGNALSSGLLLVYMVRALGASGLQVSLLLAAPALVGLLRLFTPALVAGLGSAKRVCLVLSFAAYGLLAVVPLLLVATASRLSDDAMREAVVNGLLAILCVHQLLEQIATVALWSWLGDLVPRRLRGRYFARRNTLQLLVLLPLFPAGGYAVDYLRQHVLTTPGLAHAAAIAVGTLLLLISLVPLTAMPASRPGAKPLQNSLVDRLSIRTLFAQMVQPLRQQSSRRLLLYGCWFSLFNGLFSTAQNIFPKAVLGLELAAMNVMQATMRLGQVGVSVIAGPVSDRRGNRPVLVVCQLLVGTAPLFYLAATPAHPYVIYGAWVLWSAYAGINICLPNLTMRLAPRGDHTAHLAAYQALTSVFLTVGTLTGGWLFDRYVGRTWAVGPWALDRYSLSFLLAWITRTAGAAIVATVPETANSQAKNAAR